MNNKLHGDMLAFRVKDRTGGNMGLVGEGGFAKIVGI